ncbi:hypothetical protein EVAR_49323_1 [Eumeta japonica]|uniref:Uncharacterized protein n=1 Tax=Eumeta variegata TaxID=151549 RepID=A0A4C1YAT1_EUMVA|nr:hypothetical protein EVAR_49323_1 [Eumeta japonica]
MPTFYSEAGALNQPSPLLEPGRSTPRRARRFVVAGVDIPSVATIIAGPGPALAHFEVIFASSRGNTVTYDVLTSWGSLVRASRTHPVCPGAWTALTGFRPPSLSNGEKHKKKRSYNNEPAPIRIQVQSQVPASLVDYRKRRWYHFRSRFHRRWIPLTEREAVT